MAQYESDHTKFMRQWMEKHPEEREEQRRGRALWWDKPQDLKTSETNQASHVPQKAYYYQNEH
ncbi:DUF3460 family protein [Viridibacterium curvum]|uniref:DUF3460 family protein n=1 Tax=Viridibacterium curvum TaxID=1101404 RepID=A0ABP9QLN6_9RHOO